jgi:hypothetical protein
MLVFYCPEQLLLREELTLSRLLDGHKLSNLALKFLIVELNQVPLFRYRFHHNILVLHLELQVLQNSLSMHELISRCNMSLLLFLEPLDPHLTSVLLC